MMPAGLANEVDSSGKWKGGREGEGKQKVQKEGAMYRNRKNSGA